jgi:hypothetical protein
VHRRVQVDPTRLPLRSSATVVIALLTDAIGSSAPGPMGRPEATSATPTASSRRHPPGPISPTANPGSASRSRANASNRPAATSSTPPSSLGSGRESPHSEPGALDPRPPVSGAPTGRVAQRWERVAGLSTAP